MDTQAYVPGFARAVQNSQSIFRIILEAMSRPLLVQRLSDELISQIIPPAELSPTMCASLLTLCDENTPVWLDSQLSASVSQWLTIQTGAPVTDRLEDADFVVVFDQNSFPGLSACKLGSDEEPHKSATLLLHVENNCPTAFYTVSGPGVNGDFLWDNNTVRDHIIEDRASLMSQFPRGVDILLAGESTIQGLPRTTALTLADNRDRSKT